MKIKSFFVHPNPERLFIRIKDYFENNCPFAGYYISLDKRTDILQWSDVVCNNYVIRPTCGLFLHPEFSEDDIFNWLELEIPDETITECNNILNQIVNPDKNFIYKLNLTDDETYDLYIQNVNSLINSIECHFENQKTFWNEMSNALF